uniref:Uncharacterized protein n=1 Tax=Peronospora matthiolae TaxID=2874970 RepID=A0AAV1U9F1_9STRA
MALDIALSITPAQANWRVGSRGGRSTHQALPQETGELLAPASAQQDIWLAWVAGQSQALLEQAASWWEGEGFVLLY